MEWGSLGSAEFETASRVYLYVSDVCKQYGDTELSDAMLDTLEQMMHSVTGGAYSLDKDDSLSVN